MINTANVSTFLLGPRRDKRGPRSPVGNHVGVDKSATGRLLRCKTQKDCQAYDPLSTVYSDHKLVVTKLRLSSLANGKTTAKRTSFDWHCFSTSHSVRESHTVEVKNRFEALYQLEEKHTVNDLYTTMIKAQMDEAEKCISKKKRVKK